jgi:5'-AMP-activated protein kinase catalytic alpha subunit
MMLGYMNLQAEEKVMTKMLEFGFKKDYVVRCLDANKHNHATTCYYLLLNKMMRNGMLDKRSSIF